MRRSIGLVVWLLLLCAHSPAAQGPHPIVGTWERIYQTNAAGAPNSQPAAFTIFTENGHFSQTATPPGRPRLNKLLQEMMRDELIERFQGVQARRGTYSIAGNKLTRKDVTNVDPDQEGAESVQEFRIDGDELVLISTEAGSKAQSRFRRVK